MKTKSVSVEVIELINHFNALPRRCSGYRYVMQKQRTKYVEQMGRVYSGITADPIKAYSDQFKPPYTGPIVWN